MGIAASQMERKGIQTKKGNINRQIIADNKLRKEIKSRITPISNRTKEQAKVGPSQNRGNHMARLMKPKPKSTGTRPAPAPVRLSPFRRTQNYWPFAGQRYHFHAAAL